MITDTKFTVYVLFRNDEKHSVQPTRNMADNCIDQLDRFGDTWEIFPFTITCNRDLEDLLEDAVSDDRLERWENVARTGNLSIALD